MNIVIVGLGLIGGSAAMASSGFAPEGTPVRRIGVDMDERVLEEAFKSGAVDEARTCRDAADALRVADITVLCLYPRAALSFLSEYAECIKEGAVVTDVCGVKGAFVEASASLIKQASYVGGHPMAGRELSGFQAAVPTLFRGCNYIITPSSGASQRAIGLVRDFALHLGAGRITCADAETHDRNIAYTSQLAHVLAAAVVQDPVLLECEGFAGGSLADITRVARMNSFMWSELFTLNKEHLSPAIMRLERSLAAMRGMIESGECEALRRELEQASKCKERWAASLR